MKISLQDKMAINKKKSLCKAFIATNTFITLGPLSHNSPRSPCAVSKFHIFVRTMFNCIVSLFACIMFYLFHLRQQPLLSYLEVILQ